MYLGVADLNHRLEFFISSKETESLSDILISIPNQLTLIAIDVLFQMEWGNHVPSD